MLVPPNASGGGGAGGSSPVGIVQQGRRHRRLSSLNTVSWPSPMNELTVSPRTRRRMSTVAGSDAGVQEDDVNLLTCVMFKVDFSMMPQFRRMMMTSRLHRRERSHREENQATVHQSHKKTLHWIRHREDDRASSHLGLSTMTTTSV